MGQGVDDRPRLLSLASRMHDVGEEIERERERVRESKRERARWRAARKKTNDTKGRPLTYILLLELASQVTLHECGFADATIANQYKLELRDLGHCDAAKRVITTLCTLELEYVSIPGCAVQSRVDTRSSAAVAYPGKKIADVGQFESSEDVLFCFERQQVTLWLVLNLVCVETSP